MFQIDDKTYGDLYPAFELFHQRTGLFIDPYSDVVVDTALPAFIAVLTELQTSTSLLGILEECDRTGRSVIFAGD
ncbi:MAG: hypothetical protein GYB49_04185 [Alphaproteobacteria bacterium]|nr:hypothetical protein [Alphaproteobacteria bacterium]